MKNINKPNDLSFFAPPTILARLGYQSSYQFEGLLLVSFLLAVAFDNKLA